MIKSINIMLDDKALMPTRAHSCDAGLDLYSPVNRVIGALGEWEVIDTGVHVQIPEGYVGMIKSKSGLNTKHGIQTEGVIDSGYTGSIRVAVYNFGEENYHVMRGDKISQLVIMPIETPELQLVESFKETERGSNGFGSSGR